MHEQATLRATPAFAHAAVVLEAIGPDREADGAIVAIAQAHAHGAEGPHGPARVVVVISIKRALIAIVAMRSAYGRARRHHAGAPRASRQPAVSAIPACIPLICQGGHRPLPAYPLCGCGRPHGCAEPKDREPF